MKITYNGNKFDSAEEYMFALWIDEAKVAGFVKGDLWHYKFPLTSKVLVNESIKCWHSNLDWQKKSNRVLLGATNYTSDVAISVDSRFIKGFAAGLSSMNNKSGLAYLFTDDIIERAGFAGYPTVVIEIKPPMRRGAYGDSSMQRFRLCRALVYEKYGIHVNMIEIKEWFKATWVPENLLWTGWDFWNKRKNPVTPRLRTKKDGSPYWSGYRTLKEVQHG